MAKYHIWVRAKIELDIEAENETEAIKIAEKKLVSSIEI